MVVCAVADKYASEGTPHVRVALSVNGGLKVAHAKLRISRVNVVDDAARHSGISQYCRDTAFSLWWHFCVYDWVLPITLVLCRFYRRRVFLSLEPGWFLRLAVVSIASGKGC